MQRGLADERLRCNRHAGHWGTGRVTRRNLRGSSNSGYDASLPRRVMLAASGVRCRRTNNTTKQYRICIYLSLSLSIRRGRRHAAQAEAGAGAAAETATRGWNSVEAAFGAETSGAPST